MEKSEPYLTVVTVTYNAAPIIEKTIVSVIDRLCDRIEYIVIDGGSTDGTVDIIKKYEKKINYWITEKDSGIYNAMNKALKLSRGVFVININAGDELLYIPDILNDRNIHHAEDLAGVACGVRLSDGTIFFPTMNFFMNLTNGIHHQGCFYKRVDGMEYDEKYRVFSDFDLNQKILKTGKKFLILRDVVAFHDFGGVSHNKNYFHEIYQIIKNNHGVAMMIAAWIFFKIKGVFNRLRRGL